VLVSEQSGAQNEKQPILHRRNVHERLSPLFASNRPLTKLVPRSKTGFCPTSAVIELFPADIRAGGAQSPSEASLPSSDRISTS
jgi:hypothetical protein